MTLEFVTISKTDMPIEEASRITGLTFAELRSTSTYFTVEDNTAELEEQAWQEQMDKEYEAYLQSFILSIQ